MPTERIEQALAYWEDICVLERHLAMLEALRKKKKFEPKGPLKYLGFRQVLEEGLGWSFEFLYEGDRKSLQAMKLLPLMIYAWMYSSKRVFRMSSKTIDELLREDHRPPPCTWGEFPWPFEAFVVSFETPLHLRPEADGSYDTLIVVSIVRDGHMTLLLQWLPVFLTEYQPLTGKETSEMLIDLGEEVRRGREEVRQAGDAILAKLPRKVRRLLKRQNLTAAAEKTVGYTDEEIDQLINNDKEYLHLISFPAFLIDRGLFSVIGDLNEKISEGPLMRLIYSFCNLIANGTRVTEVVGRSKHPKTGSSRSNDFTDGANIFEVGSQTEFASGVRTRHASDEPSGRTVRPHPRRGFYRRPHGSDLEAPKSEWVNSTWIHRDEATNRGLLPVCEIVVDTSKT
ncbi:MAG: hypothetical protein WC702_01190 [Patescibacteria group bacterium]